jgi:flagellar biosynthetic protein FliO
VVRYRKKIVVFLITVTLGSGVLLVCSAQSAADAEKHASPQGVLRTNGRGTELENSPVLASPQSTGCLAAVRAKSQSGSLFENDPNFSRRASDGLSTRELFFKMMVSVLFLAALGAAAIYVSKRFLPKITNLPGKEIRIAETVHLGQRKAVHLLEVGERRFLIGSTNENITKLADLEMEVNKVPKV